MLNCRRVDLIVMKSSGKMGLSDSPYYFTLPLMKWVVGTFSFSHKYWQQAGVVSTQYFDGFST